MAEKLTNNIYVRSPSPEPDVTSKKRKLETAPSLSLDSSPGSPEGVSFDFSTVCEKDGTDDESFDDTPLSKRTRIEDTSDIEHSLTRKAEKISDEVLRMQTPEKVSPMTDVLTPEHNIQKFGAPVPIMKKRAMIEEQLSQQPFKSIPHLFSQYPHPYPEKFHRVVNYLGDYQLSEECHEACIKQPGEGGSCGAGAAAMILSHYLRKDSALQVKDSFGTWYQRVEMVQVENLISGLEKHTNLQTSGYQVKNHYYSDEKKLLEPNNVTDYTFKQIKDWKGDLYSQLKKLHQSLDAPFILDIINPEIANHWIIVDKITEASVTIRDPYTGSAYTLTREEFLRNTPRPIGVSCIYLEKSTN